MICDLFCTEIKVYRFGLIDGHEDRPLVSVLAVSVWVWVNPSVDIGVRIGGWRRCLVSEVLM